jgi:hypothetical protein
MEFLVCITETYDKVESVSANSELEAIQLVRQMYDEEEIEMEAHNFTDVEFKIY